MGEQEPLDQRSERAAEPRVVARGDAVVADRGNIFFAAVEMTRMPMIVTDPRQPDNPIVFANHAFQRMTGYASADIVGRNCRFLQGTDTDAATIAEMRAAIDERREFATEILNYRKDGYSFWNALFVAPVYDAAGDLVYFFASQLDVSRRRAAEESLRQAQKMEAIGRLTGGIAHDFNNLLQVIVGYLELINAGINKPEIDRAKLTRSIGNSKAAADRASALTQQLLAFARKQHLEGRILNLNGMLGQMSDIVARTLGAEVVVTYELRDGLANCRVDPTQVETALLNILINARDAMVGKAGKRVTLRTDEVVVGPEHDHPDLRNLGTGRYVGIAVIDNGDGIPAQVIERVMDPFFTTKEEGHGTGLGLSMVYGFAKQSGGGASISSEKGGGTTVRMLFPAVDEAATHTRDERGSALDRPGHETILLVEDRPDVAELARTILDDLGYTLLIARTALEALDLFEKHGDKVDLLFTDLIMPGTMNGVALAREIKRRRGSVKVLLTTGYTEASLERTDAGGTEFDVLNKPYGRSELARKIRVVLDGATGVS